MHPTWLCTTHMVSGTKVATPYWKDFILLYFFIFNWWVRKNRFLLFYLDIPFILLEKSRFLLLVIHVTNSTRVIYLYALGSDYFLATNLLDLSLGLDRGRPIWATFVIGQTDSLRDKLQTLPIFMFILYQMDKLSGICIVSPNTKALALHSRVVLALNSFHSFFFILF
jgi:hypothetical protein